jgi:DNA polymerase-1
MRTAAYDSVMPQTCYLIDGHSQIYRAYYAPFGNLSSPAGEPTRATHVFFQLLLNMIRDRKPDYVVMVLDGDESKLERKKIYPEYKAHREPPPEDLPVQERRIISILNAIGMPIIQRDGCEADDVIATLARRLAHQGLHVFLVSRDKDLDQLLSDHVSLYDPLKNEVVTPQRLFETKGWRPEQAVDAQTLIGDSVDNVPGVPGVGPKTAAKLIQKYGSAAGVVAHADELSPKQRENVLAFAPLMERTRQLVTLNPDIPLELDLAAAAVGRLRWSAARPIFEELGFKRLPEQLPKDGADAGAASAATEPPAPGGPQVAESDDEGDAAPELDFPPASAAAPVPPQFAALAARLREPDRGDWRLVNTPEAFEALVAALAGQREFALDTETTGVDPTRADLVGIALAWEVGRGYYIPVRTMYGDALPLERVRERLAPLLADPRTRKVGHNIKYDLIVLRIAGMPVAGPIFDTMIAAFALDPARMSYGMDSLVAGLIGHTMIPITDLIGKGRDQLRMDQVPVAHVAEYAAEDADYTWRMKELFEPQLAPSGVEQLFRETEMPLVRVLTEMEFNGVRIDVDYLKVLSREMAARAEQLQSQVHALVGAAFNLDSPKQLAEVLFDRLGFRVVKHTRTARSTDAETLEALAAETGHPALKLILEYRELQKLRGTYVDALPAAINPRTGRVHTSYHQTGAITGRLSSSEPNLQNIPIRTELGRQIRRAFVPRAPDELLVVADYSQVELRILAHYSQDEQLLRAFQEDQDIHAFVAAQVHGVPQSEVTREMRGRAKAVNFGIIYGQTAFGLARATGMSRTEAQQFIDDYFRRYPRVQDFIHACIETARRDGAVRTILNRRRPIANLDSRNRSLRAQAERLAVNTVMQGSAADLIKRAMVLLHERIVNEGLPLRMLLQVHDELVCEAPRAEAAELGRLVAGVMSSALALRVPLKVDVACGENWLEAK